MPIYEYVCEDCFNKFELVRSFNQADDKILCTSCNSINTHRIVSKCFSKGDLSGSNSSSSCHSCSGGNCSHCGH